MGHTRSYLPYAKQSISEEDIQAVADALKEEWITRGPLVQEFEQACATYLQVPYAIAFNSGTAALMAAYFAAGLCSFDRVISTPNTFIATLGGAIEIGIAPCFIDIDRLTGNMDMTQVTDQFDFSLKRGRPFIVPVHFSGLALDMEKLSNAISHPDAVIIEDAAHALGSFYPCGQKVGNCVYSDMTIFSFHPAKSLTTGEGGMVTTRNPEFYHRLQLFRNNGIERHAPYLRQPEADGYYEVQAISGNFNFTSFQAALGLSQLRRLDRFIEKRRKLVKLYRKRLANIPHLILFHDNQDESSAFHLFVVQIDFAAYRTTREKVMRQLHDQGIGTQVHYIPLYHHPVVRARRELQGVNHPNMELYYQQTLSLPLYVDLREEEIERICHALIEILGGAVSQK
ncbi:MAG: DegT/DnrJ/EryC1/StrS family aminotransferase [Parachlamydiaceae bacterium]